MFGQYYAVELQGEPSFENRFRYAGDILAELLNRALVLRHLVGESLSHPGDPPSNALGVALNDFTSDCEEAAARGGRLGLFTPCDDGYAMPIKPNEADVAEVGGLLVGKEGE